MSIEYLKLGNIATYINGYAFKPEDWENQGKPIIRIQNLTNSSDELNYFNKDINEKYIVKTGDILISWSASIGIYEWNKSEAVLNQHIFKVVFDKINVNKQYYKFMVGMCLEKAMKYMHGSTMKHITKKYFDDILVPVPDLKVQEKVAKVLNKSQELIDKRKAQMEALDELVKSQFIEMFGDPSKNPMGWKETTIGDSCYYVKDGPHASPNYVEKDKGIPFISVRNIVDGYINWDTAKYISEDDYETFIKKCEPEKGDVLYSKGGTTGIAKYIDTDKKFANWVHIAVLKFEKDLDGIFFENMLNSAYCYQQSQRLTKGIANRDLVLGSMKQIKFYLPPIELQNQFADFVKQVDKLKFEMQKSLEEMENNFNSLMQRAFKGELFN
ncbi:MULTISPECIES: restriction endonuclease subunit S [Clostridium]|uniref:Restriction endonuclease subunit S n=1 Tax=Clostridium beijerinckii TaxID=1520 RepID=A0AAW3W7D2_CLOBE|nr:MULTISPECIES: restriction endonuclease subunit S [Clostridium]EHJ01986.1 restriction modification system DNA specificity domain containing protein [Clostridium sp. DL-VIII]MBC2457544.1 restriction endonuclease subunit S [Clostridium beijerinckii]MBC2474631.1 restriction endonuclease subunit S [Clostridium beijerinckii]NOV62412.1 type I restriction enzyme S subunit [Clostridium beijerinckii]NOV68091.1 type I restriction enzyme S subunit [Clostridium beijerinckii]